MIQVEMVFTLQDGLPWVRFQACSPTGRYSSFIAPLAELFDYIERAFMLMENFEPMLKPTDEEIIQRAKWRAEIEQKEAQTPRT